MRRLILPALLLCAGCTTLGPDHVAPAAPAGDWHGAADAGAVDPAWWATFGDPLLTRLVERALVQAPQLAEAEARLAEARAGRAAIAGQGLPQVQASGSASENRISENGQFPVSRIPGFPTEFTMFDAGFDASWELDLWGRRARMLEAASADAAMAEALRDGVRVTLAAEVARNYAELRVAQGALASARRAAGARGELARLAALLAESGEGNAIEAEAAAAAAAAAAVTVPLAEARATAAAYAIAALLGEPPEALAAELLAPAPIPQAPEAILAGVRADLIRRRPDLRAAERDLAAATARIGVATADLYPRFTLLGGLGLQARSMDGLADGGSLRALIGPGFSWPVFSGGAVRAQIAAADARAQAAAARFDGALAGALAESESAINRWLASRAAEDAARSAQARQARAFALAQLRHESGEDSRIALEQARLALIDADRALAEARGASLLAAVALNKALGGGWETAPPAPASVG